jgi:hypothetical protein
VIAATSDQTESSTPAMSALSQDTRIKSAQKQAMVLIQGLCLPGGRAGDFDKPNRSRMIIRGLEINPTVAG